MFRVFLPSGIMQQVPHAQCIFSVKYSHLHLQTMSLLSRATPHHCYMTSPDISPSLTVRLLRQFLNHDSSPTLTVLIPRQFSYPVTSRNLTVLIPRQFSYPDSSSTPTVLQPQQFSNTDSSHTPTVLLPRQFSVSILLQHLLQVLLHFQFS